MTNAVDEEYLSVLENALNSPYREDRTGTGTHSYFGEHMRFDLRERFPILTTKRIHFKSVLMELLWFLRGDTNTAYLHDHGVSIWDEWQNDNGDLGLVYGHQFRNQNGVDQWSNCVDSIQNDPNSRRHIISLWNASDLDEMALPPCHGLVIQFYVRDGELSCHMYQRSADVFLGLGFNISSYALMVHIMASLTGTTPGDLLISLGDVHLYSNHVDQAREQLSREPRDLPVLVLNPRKSVEEYEFSDFMLYVYDPHPTIKARVSV